MGRYAIQFLIVITALAWGALITEGFFLNALSGRGFAVLCAISALAPVLAAIRAHSEQSKRTMVRAMARHSERMERALEHHAELVAKQERLVEKMTECIFRGLARANIDAASCNGGPADTGPFPVFDRHLG